MKVKGVGTSYWRVVGNLEELIEKAKDLSSEPCLALALRGF